MMGLGRFFVFFPLQGQMRTLWFDQSSNQYCTWKEVVEEAHEDLISIAYLLVLLDIFGRISWVIFLALSDGVHLIFIFGG